MEEEEKLRKSGVKSPSKLFKKKYLSTEDPPKQVHFINSITVTNEEKGVRNDSKDEDVKKKKMMMKKNPRLMKTLPTLINSQPLRMKLTTHG